MIQYYWNPNLQPQPYYQNFNQQRMTPTTNLQNSNQQRMQWNPNYQSPSQQQHVPPISNNIPGGIPSGLPQGERSYIENILRLNIGDPGIFYFSFSQSSSGSTITRNITGSVEAAGRDHVIIKEASSGNSFLFPMIYFDYAEFEGDINYFPQTIESREI